MTEPKLCPPELPSGTTCVATCRSFVSDSAPGRGSESLVNVCQQEQVAFPPWAPIRNLDGNRSGHEMDSAPQHRDAADRHRIAARPVVVDLFDPGHRTRFTPGPRRRHSDQAGPGRGRSLSGHAAGLAEATWTGEVMQWAA